MDFFTRIEELARSKRTSLCVGLDPRVPVDSADPRSDIVASNRRIIEATAPYALCFKPNMAFYEAHGPAGLQALEDTLSLIPTDIPVIIDAKRCDIDATAEAYAHSILGRLSAFGHVLAVTLSPYMGRDAVDPFLKYADAGVFMLCKTSNPGAGVFQRLDVSDGTAGTSSVGQLCERVASVCCSWSDRVGLVVAGNDPMALRQIRAAAPDAWFLAPGIGAQGGKADEALSAGARKDGYGILVMAARSVAEAPDPAAAARALRDVIESAREALLARSSDERAVDSAQAFDPVSRLKIDLFKAFIATGCFRLGDFVLKSGKRSPFYIDLRRLVSDPGAMALAASAYAQAASGCAYRRIAGIPAAALPLSTAACMRIGVPMIWPRMPAKEHGTGNRVEGAYEKGERVLLLDDLITTGASKLEAVSILRSEGLVVEDLVVLMERGRQGRRDMESNGIALHSFAHVRELFSVCESTGLIDAARRAELERYVDEE